MSFNRTLTAARKRQKPRGPNGERFCRWCRLEVKPPRRTFCGASCVHEYRLRSSTSYLRQCVFKRDKGICAKCGLDTKQITKGFRKPLKGETKSEWKRRVAAVRKKYKIPKHRKTFWDIDHIIEVAAGGGEAGLAEVQTLCHSCHLEKSKDFMKKRRADKKLKK